MKITIYCISCTEEKLETDDTEIDQLIEMRLDGPICINNLLRSITSIYKCSICHKKVSITLES